MLQHAGMPITGPADRPIAGFERISTRASQTRLQQTRRRNIVVAADNDNAVIRVSEYVTVVAIAILRRQYCNDESAIDMSAKPA